MKKITLSIILTLIISITAYTQDTLYIYKSGVITHKIATSDIDSITFEKAKKLNATEKLFRLLANASTRGQESVDVGEFNIPFKKKDGTLDEEYKNIYASFLAQYPYLFHLERDGSININYKTDNPLQVQNYNFDYVLPISSISEWIPKYEQAMEDFYSCLREGMSDQEIAYALHQKLTDKTTYKQSGYPFHAIGPLIDKKGVCQGYSYAYYILMQNLGIKTDVVRGFIPGMTEHVWNRLMFDGEWYNVDATWDDTGNEDEQGNATTSGKYFLTSDEAFYQTQGHPKVYEIPVKTPGLNKKFDANTYFFRNNREQTNAAYVDGYWYYLSMRDMTIYKSRFDGTEKKAIHTLKRAPQPGNLWCKVEFGADKMYFVDLNEGKNCVYSIEYNGQNLTKGKEIGYFELSNKISLKEKDADIYVPKTFSVVALRAEIALSKIKDAYYHDKEDFFMPSAPERVNFVELIRQAERFIKSSRSAVDKIKAADLYQQLHTARKNYSMKITH